MQHDVPFQSQQKYIVLCVVGLRCTVLCKIKLSLLLPAAVSPQIRHLLLANFVFFCIACSGIQSNNESTRILNCSHRLAASAVVGFGINYFAPCHTHAKIKANTQKLTESER